MAQRAVAECDGKLIGIESIYTVIGGKQINIPEKLKDLREKSNNGKLFCPCRCGSNLVLVAGDKNLREQHFRIKHGQYNEKCTAITEGKTSVESKIVLKCWLDDNLHAEDLETRVPICDVADSSRKYEFTFISLEKSIALDYCFNRANLSDEKQSILEQNSVGINVIHIVDYMNGGSVGQYPEGLMKIQKKQKYCLLLETPSVDYEAARMKAVYYGQDLDGMWREVILAQGLLKDFTINTHGIVFYWGNSLEVLLDKAIEGLKKRNETERQRREEEKARIAKYQEQRELEAEQLRDKQRKLREEREERLRVQIQEATQRRAELKEKNQIETKRKNEERERRESQFIRSLSVDLDQQEKQVIDANGNRWIKCEYCGKIGMTSEFIMYGGAIGKHLNLGTCKDCRDNNPVANQPASVIQKPGERKKPTPMSCPICGHNLVERNGKNGKFLGCSGFPVCRYSRSIWD